MTSIAGAQVAKRVTRAITVSFDQAILLLGFCAKSNLTCRLSSCLTRNLYTSTSDFGQMHIALLTAFTYRTTFRLSIIVRPDVRGLSQGLASLNRKPFCCRQARHGPMSSRGGTPRNGQVLVWPCMRLMTGPTWTNEFKAGCAAGSDQVLVWPCMKLMTGQTWTNEWQDVLRFWCGQLTYNRSVRWRPAE
jgi:hypothetical protein